MSHTRVKVKYEEEGPWGSTTDETLYCDHNHSSDMVTFYHADGSIMLTINEFSSNNLWSAMETLMYYHKHHLDGERVKGFSKESGIEYYNKKN